MSRLLMVGIASRGTLNQHVNFWITASGVRDAWAGGHSQEYLSIIKKNSGSGDQSSQLRQIVGLNKKNAHDDKYDDHEMMISTMRSTMRMVTTKQSKVCEWVFSNTHVV